MNVQANYLGRVVLSAVALIAGLYAQAASAAPEPTLISAFGDRPAFSPDGKRLAFVGKAYGDAYEMDLATRKVRNLTQNVPHQGVLRIQYLANGDYLITAPQRHIDANTRAHLQMWVLSKDLKSGFRPLGEAPLEGIAVSRRSNRIAWTAFAPGISLGPKDSWIAMFSKPTKRYVADIVYTAGAPRIANKREIMSTLPQGCTFTEPQDFRDADRELLFSCSGFGGGAPLISAMGYSIPNDTYTTYRRVLGEYNEFEGVAPDGSWATVECGKQSTSGVDKLDICRIELKPDGAISKIFSTDRFHHIGNPVVNPNGRQIAFQTGDGAGEVGEGMGVYLLDLPR
jgi:hypothetical protein